MNVYDGATGMASKSGDAIAVFEISDTRQPTFIRGRFGEVPRRGRDSGQVVITFFEIEGNAGGRALAEALGKYQSRQERCPPFGMDLELDDGRWIPGCFVHSAWPGGHFSLDLPD